MVHGRPRLRRDLGRPRRPPRASTCSSGSVTTSTGCWILAAAIFALACSPLAGPRLLLTPDGWQAGTKVVLYAVAGAFFVLPLVFGPEREGWARRQLTGPVPFWLGEISYGIFAIHMLVLNLVFRALDLDVFTGRFITVALLTLGATLVLATISFYLFEKPILRLKNVRFFARMEPRQLAPEPRADSGDRSLTLRRPRILLRIQVRNSTRDTQPGGQRGHQAGHRPPGSSPGATRSPRSPG